MSRFNIRTIVAETPTLSQSIQSKPSAYSAMKYGTSAPVNTVITPEEPKKKGRPSKEEARKHKLQLADAGIQILVENKPTRNKIREYFQSRIEQLDEEKR